MFNFERIAGVLERTMSVGRRMLLIVAFLAFAAGCATATKQPSLYDTQPDLLTKQYSADQIKAIEQNFNVNPLQYSQKLGNLLLWQMHQKSPEFALEFAQTPELNDGINKQEVRAMVSIYNLIKNLDIPRCLFEEKKGLDSNVHKILMEWYGDSEKKSDWSGFFYQSPQGKIFDAKPINFEQGEDRIDYERLKKYGDLKWESMSASGDRDSIIVTVKYPTGNKIFFDINGQMLSFTKLEMLKKDSLLFNEKNGLEGTLIIKNAYDATKPERELFVIRDMVLAGEGGHKFSAPLQALLWGYMDSKFKEDNPFENYIDALEFVKPIWGDMKDKRWSNFDEVADRVNTPKLFDYWVNKVIDYGDPIIGYTKPARQTFKDLRGDCSDICELGQTILGRSGYNVMKICTPDHVMGYIKKDNLYWLAIDFTPMGNALIGPSKNLYELIGGRVIFPCGPGVDP